MSIRLSFPNTLLLEVETLVGGGREYGQPAVVDHRLLGLDTTCTKREFPTKQPLFDFGDSRFSVIRVFLFFSIAEFRETPEIPCEGKPKWHTSNKNIPHEWWTLVPSHSPHLFALALLVLSCCGTIMENVFCAAVPSSLLVLMYAAENVTVMPDDDGFSSPRTFRPPLSLETSFICSCGESFG